MREGRTDIPGKKKKNYWSKKVKIRVKLRRRSHLEQRSCSFMEKKSEHVNI